jgi:hypothetical protein
VLRLPSVDGLPPAALRGAKLLKKFDQNFLLPFGRLLYRHFRLDTAPDFFKKNLYDYKFEGLP